MRRFSKFYSTIFIPILFFLFLISCESTKRPENISTIEKNREKGTTLNIGLISNQIQNDVRLHSQFMEYLIDSLSSVGVSDVELVVTRSIDSLLVKIENSSIDICFDSPYPTKILTQSGKLEVTLLQHKAGSDYYGSYIFTKQGNGVTKLDDLKGKVLGFEKRYSTSGYYLPYSVLQKEGYKLREVKDINSNVEDDEIGFIFTEDDENTIYWVLRDKLTAGATDNISYEQYLKDKKDQLQIIHKTEKIPRHLVSLKSNLNPEIKERLINLLVEMHKSERGKKVLDGFYGTSEFNLLTPKDMDTITSL